MGVLKIKKKTTGEGINAQSYGIGNSLISPAFLRNKAIRNRRAAIKGINAPLREKNYVSIMVGGEPRLVEYNGRDASLGKMKEARDKFQKMADMGCLSEIPFRKPA